MAKNRKQQQRINARKQARIQKANTTSEQRASKKQLSTAAIEVVRKVLEILKPFELSMTQRNKTFASMLLDDCVFAGFDSRATSIELAQNNGKFVFDKKNEKSIEIKKFLEYNMKMMTGQSVRSVGRSSAEMIAYGWAPHEIVTHKQDGEYGEMFTLKKLAYIHPLSLDQRKPYQVKEGGDEIEYLRQSSTAFAGSDGTYGGKGHPWRGIKEIDFRRIATASYSATDSTPQGTSVFEAIYVLWREKQLLQDMLLNGVQRDFSGTPILRLPSDVLEAAENDPSSPEAAQVAALAGGMQEMHSGDATFMILPSDSQSENGTGLRDYEIQFLGVEGGGKGFNITEIIEQKKKGIHMVLTTQHLLAGENGGGSYNLHEGQVSTAALASERDNQIVDDMWNKVVFPKLLRLNSIDYTLADLPVWKHGEAQPISYDEFGKFVNRVGRMLPAVPDVGNKLLEMMNVDYRIDDDATPEEIRAMAFEFSEPSKVGTGGGSSGTGDTQAGGASSDKNSENSA
ncbi:putative portal protein [Vibrio phage 424E50-1]|nr:putative portal protein [Vibrio phage 424E50-1]